MKQVVPVRPPPVGTLPREQGFTILEILIATAILTLGLVSILALFPYAIDLGKKVMERSTAVTIAKSVAEEIRAGIRNKKRVNTFGPMSYAYFVFDHDGVKDPIPRSREQERPSHDYYILFPKYRQEAQFEGATEDERRNKGAQAGMEFVYPEDDEPMNGGGNPFMAENDADDSPDKSQIMVRKVYTIGNLLPGIDGAKGVAPEAILDDQIQDPFKQYSYAFSIRASKFDTNLSLNPRVFQPGNSLYHIRVMIFRAFTFNEERAQQDGKGPEPIYEMDFEVAK